MSTKLITPWKRPNSAFYWFRMVVPLRYRTAVGKSEIKQSLGTSDLGDARRLCAQTQAQWLVHFREIENGLQEAASIEGVEIVDRYLDEQANLYGGMSAVMSYELKDFALSEAAMLILDAERDYEGADGARSNSLAEPCHAEALAIREAIELRRNALLHNRQTALLPGREAAHRARTDTLKNMAAGFLEEAFGQAGLDLDTSCHKFAVAADRYLQRLLEYRTAELDRAEATFPVPYRLAAISANGPHASATKSAPPIRPVIQTSVPASSPTSDVRSTLRASIQGEAANARTITQVFEAWAAKQPLESKKLIDEWRVAIRRFVEIFGDIDVTEIDSGMVMDFRDAMRGLPSRPKRAVAELPLLEQIEVARRDELPTLAGPTVGKLLSGLRVTLSHARDPLRLISVNPAAGISVDDATSEVDARVAFSPEDLKAIYSMPLMTKPTGQGPNTEFWLTFLAPLSGLRIEEMGKLRPGNVQCERGIWYIRVIRDTRSKRRERAASGQTNKRAKTKSAYRDIPLHPTILEAGFVEFALRQKEAGQEWLFTDLVADEYGNRSKSASRRLIRKFRKLGIDEEEKVFHSFRHSMKRACRNTPMKEEISDLLAGHAPDSVGRKYGAGADLKTLNEAIAMITYETIDWAPVVSCARS